MASALRVIEKVKDAASNEVTATSYTAEYNVDLASERVGSDGISGVTPSADAGSTE